jgi:5-hydroxyisourate hydrolase
MSAISTHVLDTALGRPAAGVPVRLERLLPDGPQVLGSATTDDDGRVAELGPEQVEPGRYRLVFDVAGYHGGDGFFPEVAIIFVVGDAEHYHVPLLLSPYGYSTYRGS